MYYAHTHKYCESLKNKKIIGHIFLHKSEFIFLLHLTSPKLYAGNKNVLSPKRTYICVCRSIRTQLSIIYIIY